MDNQTEKSRVLLIDDDTSLLLMLSDFLKFEGYDVTTAESGEAGLKRLERMSPDLIILDMSMPGMGGIGFLKAISNQDGKPRYPVLVLTARANMAEFFADVDVDGFIAKPCDTQILLNEVGRIIFLRRGSNQGRGRAGGRRKVLLAEDEEILRRRLARGFGDAGYVVETASSGPEMIERAIVGRPDLIVSRLVMKGMNGNAAANVLKEMPNTRSVPIVLYDDTGTAADDATYTRSGSRIAAVVRSHDLAELLEAAAGVLETEEP
jgi:CheY-like chemotaxis protein